MVAGDELEASAILTRCVFMVQPALCLQAFWNIKKSEWPSTQRGLSEPALLHSALGSFGSKRTIPFDYYVSFMDFALLCLAVALLEAAFKLALTICDSRFTALMFLPLSGPQRSTWPCRDLASTALNQTVPIAPGR